MSDVINTVESLARTHLRQALNGRTPTEKEAKEAIELFSKIEGLTEPQMKTALKALEADMAVNMDVGSKFYDRDTYVPWVSDRKSSIDPYYWNRYRQYLLEQGWNEKVVDSLDEVSDDILDCCGDPNNKGHWLRKGLILGDIQSGKTSNYLALCNKAADAGYKVIILLTGTIESLRKQTQRRVDAGFVGVDSRNTFQKDAQMKYTGVGLISNIKTAVSFTTTRSDFSSKALETNNFTLNNINDPIIFVLKKNKSVLNHLKSWLISKNLSTKGESLQMPLLLIDDEADNASVNTNKQGQDPTAINKAIVDVLKLFSCASYVGVTATPFANIFIDPDLDRDEDFNLFPSDFIYSLSAPTNYIGADSIFGENAEHSDALEVIDDDILDETNSEYVFRSKRKSAHMVKFLPESLKTAIDYFLLFNAVRDLKGSTESDRSMLINVSQFVNVQEQVFELVKTYLRKSKQYIQAYCRLSYSEGIKHPEIARLEKEYTAFEFEKKTGFTWEQVRSCLYEAVAPIEMRLINLKAKSSKLKPLDYDSYEHGLRVIAVGGNSLSRGLTLEGLAVSYFDRNSQNYDTLMQMGRWFGYRKGYDNLFKIWMKQDAIDWYQYITTAQDELKSSIDTMKASGLTPKDFGLRVQQNQTSLFVTAANKRRETKTVEQFISLSGEVIETPQLIASRENCLQPNLNLTNALLEELLDNEKYCPKDDEYNFSKNCKIFRDVPKERIAEYISGFIAHPRHIPFETDTLSSYIRTHEHLWTVVLMGGDQNRERLSSQYFPKQITDLQFGYSFRKILLDGSCLMISGHRARVGAPGATRFGLKKADVDRIEKDYRNSLVKDNSNKKKSNTYPDKIFLKPDIPNRQPVLLIYIVKVNDEMKTVDNKSKPVSDQRALDQYRDMPIIAIELGFLGDGTGRHGRKVKYVLNKIFQRQMNLDDDAYEGDDEDELMEF